MVAFKKKNKIELKTNVYDSIASIKTNPLIETNKKSLPEIRKALERKKVLPPIKLDTGRKSHMEEQIDKENERILKQ